MTSVESNEFFNFEESTNSPWTLIRSPPFAATLRSTNFMNLLHVDVKCVREWSRIQEMSRERGEMKPKNWFPIDLPDCHLVR